MSDIVSSLVEQINAGNTDYVKSVCADNTVSVTHLMLASRNFVDPAQLAKQITNAPTNARRNIVVTCLLDAVARANQVQAQPEPVVVQAEPEQMPFEPDQPKEEKAPATRSRRRAPAAVVETQQEVPMMGQPVVEQQPVTSVNQDLAAIVSLLRDVAHEQQTRLASLEDRMFAINENTLERMDRILAQGADNNQRLHQALQMLETLDIKVEKFRAGTEALEIALIGKGLLDSAPFADSWNNV